MLNRGIFEEASFVEGEPWEVGSRLVYLVSKPAKAKISAVINSISPPRSISLINHALGVTADQHVTFGPDLKGGTRVRMTFDLLGESTEMSPPAIHDAITFLAQVTLTLDTLAELCHRAPYSSASGM